MCKIPDCTRIGCVQYLNESPCTKAKRICDEKRSQQQADCGILQPQYDNRKLL